MSRDHKLSRNRTRPTEGRSQSRTDDANTETMRTTVEKPRVRVSRGTDAEELTSRHGRTLGGNAETLERLAARHGREQIDRWAQEGMDVETMGDPSAMRAFRENQTDDRTVSSGPVKRSPAESGPVFRGQSGPTRQTADVSRQMPGPSIRGGNEGGQPTEGQTQTETGQNNGSTREWGSETTEGTGGVTADDLEGRQEPVWVWKLDEVAGTGDDPTALLPITGHGTEEVTDMCFKRLGLEWLETDQCAQLDYEIFLNAFVDGDEATVVSNVKATLTEEKPDPRALLNHRTEREYYEMRRPQLPSNTSLADAYIEEHGEQAYEEEVTRSRSVDVEAKGVWTLTEDGLIHQKSDMRGGDGGGWGNTARSSGLRADAIAKGVDSHPPHDDPETPAQAEAYLLARTGFDITTKGIEMQGSTYTLDLSKFVGVLSDQSIFFAGTDKGKLVDLKFVGFPAPADACQYCQDP